MEAVELSVSLGVSWYAHCTLYRTRLNYLARMPLLHIPTKTYVFQEVSIAIYLHLSWGSNQDSLCMCPSLNHLVGVTHAMYVRLRGDILLAAGLLHNKKVLIDTLGFS